MKALVVVLLLAAPAYAFDPLHPGLPACEGGESGYWQAITTEKDGRQTVSLALTSIDYLDPAYVICWVDPAQLVTAGDMKPSTPIKRQSSRKDRTVGALHELYAETR
jgi:hypothetical protein